MTDKRWIHTIAHDDGSAEKRGLHLLAGKTVQTTGERRRRQTLTLDDDDFSAELYLQHIQEFFSFCGKSLGYN